MNKYCLPNEYCLPNGYIQRFNNTFHDDRTLKDENQKEVYEFASRLSPVYRRWSILDLGCGSGYKLLQYFPNSITIGVDLPQTVEWLTKQYPKRIWRSWDQGPVEGVDLVICADMIEHVPDANEVLSYIEGCNPVKVVMSTPDRSMLSPPGSTTGPPNNGCHVREWTMQEFRSYLEQKGWKVIRQEITNISQCTQTVVCEVPQ